MLFKNDGTKIPLLNRIAGNAENKDICLQAGASINLTQIGNGKYAKVLELQGGHRAAGRLEAMGIVPGVIIMKKTATLMKGPVVIEKGDMQFAIGYAMAQKIIVAPFDEA